MNTVKTKISKSDRIWHETFMLFIESLSHKTYKKFQSSMNKLIKQTLTKTKANPYKELRDFNFGFSLEYKHFDLSIKGYWLQYSNKFIRIKKGEETLEHFDVEISESSKKEYIILIAEMFKLLEVYKEIPIKELLEND